MQHMRARMRRGTGSSVPAGRLGWQVAKRGAGEPVVIKKYANRRLYNTDTSSYVTLDHLCQLVKDGTDFVVYDAKSGDDITRTVLAQIIFEEESRGQALLPVPFLRQLIGFYGDALETVVPRYLELSFEAFARHREELRRGLDGAFGGGLTSTQLEAIDQRNMAMFEQAMRAFDPAAAPSADRAEPAAPDGEIAELKHELEALRSRLNALASKRP